MKSEYIAMLMSKKLVDSNISFFIPVTCVYGDYDSVTGVFSSNDCNNFLSMNGLILDLFMESDKEFVVDYIMSKDAFFKKYGKNTAKYVEEKMELCKVIYPDSDKLEYKIRELKTDDFISFLDGNYSSDKVENEEMTEIDKKLEDELSILDTFNEYQRLSIIQDKIDNNELTANELKQMRRTLKNLYDYNQDIRLKITDIIGDKKECSDIHEITTTTSKSIDHDNSKRKKYLERKQLIENIKNVVIGQDEHVERIVVEIFRMMSQLNYGSKKRSILLTGSTGVGKTKICELIGRYLDMPVKIIDTTQLSMPGYKGQNIEDFLEQLYDSENGNIERVEHSIVIFDEMDKKGSTSNSDVSGRGVLNQFLKFLDGTTYTIKDGNGYLSKDKRLISTKNMIVIAAGAFSNVYNNPIFKKKSMGFNEQQQTKREVTLEDINKIGGIPDELLGRLSTVIHLNDLTEDLLKNILLSSSESDIKQVQKEFMEEANTKLVFTSDAINTIAHQAYEKKTGARALQQVVYESTWRAFQEVTDNYGKYKEVYITEDTILDNNNYQLERNNNKTNIKRR